MKFMNLLKSFDLTSQLIRWLTQLKITSCVYKNTKFFIELCKQSLIDNFYNVCWKIVALIYY